MYRRPKRSDDGWQAGATALEGRHAELLAALSFPATPVRIAECSRSLL